VDYNKNGVMERLPVTSATATAGTVTKIPGNDKGVWVAGNARKNDSFSAKVELFTEIKDVTGACAYASNYPPVGEYIGTNVIQFTGTAPYTVMLEGVSEPQTAGSYYMAAGTIKSFTDKTGAPGVINCPPPVPPTVVDAILCFGLPGQLQAVAPGSATIAWYDAPTLGNLLHTGNVLLLTPLYNASAPYYAQSVSAVGCVSASRTQAIYAIKNCTMSEDCPEYTVGHVGADTPTAAACSSFYPGQIGAADYPVACVSYDAGHIGK
jgi:hypothetical protein